jgi:putative transposase
VFHDAVVATSLLRHRIVEDFESDKGLKLGLVSEQIGLVFSRVIAKLRSFFGNAAKAVREALRRRPCSVVAGLAADLLRSRSELVAENVLLRQQLIVVAGKATKPVFQRHERTLITLLAAVLPRWREALLLVKPETVLRWHRGGFRLLWPWKSRSTKTPVSRMSPDVVELIRRDSYRESTLGSRAPSG